MAELQRMVQEPARCTPSSATSPATNELLRARETGTICGESNYLNTGSFPTTLPTAGGIYPVSTTHSNATTGPATADASIFTTSSSSDSPSTGGICVYSSLPE